MSFRKSTPKRHSENPLRNVTPKTYSENLLQKATPKCHPKNPLRNMFGVFEMHDCFGTAKQLSGSEARKRLARRSIVTHHYKEPLAHYLLFGCQVFIVTFLRPMASNWFSAFATNFFLKPVKITQLHHLEKSH